MIEINEAIEQKIRDYWANIVPSRSNDSIYPFYANGYVQGLLDAGKIVEQVLAEQELNKAE
jgi:hypothetical protein